jgi:hypothetical protein
MRPRRRRRGSRFTPIEAPEFRRLGDEGVQSRLAYARARWPEGRRRPARLGSCDRTVDVPIELGKLGLQEIGLQEIGMP